MHEKGQEDRISHVVADLAAVKTKLADHHMRLLQMGEVQRKLELQLAAIGGQVERIADRLETAWSDARNKLDAIEREHGELMKAVTTLTGQLHSEITRIREANDRFVRRALLTVIAILLTVLVGIAARDVQM